MTANLIRQLFLLLLVSVGTVFILIKLVNYLPAILGAVTFYFLLRNWMDKLLAKNWNTYSAAGFLLICSVLGIVLPIVGIIKMLLPKLPGAVTLSETLTGDLNAYAFTWQDRFGIQHIEVFGIWEITDFIFRKFPAIAGGSISVVVGLLIMYIILFFLLTNSGKWESYINEFLPLKSTNLKRMGERCSAIVKSNAVGIPLLALGKAALCLVGFLIFDIPNPFFWFVLVAIASIVPYLGTLIGIIPIFLLSMSNGENFQAWGILIYAIIIVGVAGQILERLMEKHIENVHPLTTLLGVIVGVPLLGVVGLIFGPLMISLFLVTIRIYHREFGSKDVSITD